MSKVKRETTAILRKYPNTRDNPEYFMMMYISMYLDGDYQRLNEISIESYIRARRYVQNTEKKYQPSENVKKRRRKKEQEYREYYGSKIKHWDT